MAADKQVNRRRFFLEGFRELLKPLSRSIAPIEEAARQFGQLEARSLPPPESPPPDPEPSRFRPPGALPETEFTALCSRCGDCARVCPVQAIHMDEGAEGNSGLPYIDMEIQPCTLCDGTPCMHQCPTGALRSLAIEEIDIGMARWIPYSCIRAVGGDCTMCIDICPLGPIAIEGTDGAIQINEDGCVGCGLCRHHCPTEPKSIEMIPRIPQ